MTRLWDRIIGREPAPKLTDADRAAFSTLTQLYATPDAERILPQFEYFAAEAFGGNSIIYALVARRIALFSEAVFKYRSLSDKHLFGNASLSKLENPWPNGSTGELLARMEQDVSLAGNAYIRDAGSRLERLRPDWVTIVSEVTTDDEGRTVREVLGYLFQPFGDGARPTEFYLVDEVAHWSPMPDPLANFRGMSWLTPVIRDINADVSMTAHREAFFRNGATPNIVIKYAQKLLPAQRDLIRDTIAARHAGPTNAFGTMVLDQGADMTVVGDRMQGSAFSDLQAAGETRLAAAAGVPGIVVGLQQGRQTGAPGEYSDAIRGFVDLTIRPNWRTACSALTKFSVPPSGSQLWFDTTDISALQPGQKDAAGTMQVQAGTTNTLIIAGYDPDAVVQSVTAGDLSLLLGKHSGLTSVQMHKPGDNPDPTDAVAPPAAPAAPDGPGAGDERNPPPPVTKPPKSGRFDADELRETNGKWAGTPGGGVFHALDKLKIGDRIPLGHDEHLVSTAKVQGFDGGVRMAVTSGGDEPGLRFGVGGSHFWELGSRWKGAQGSYTTRLDARGVADLRTHTAEILAADRKSSSEVKHLNKQLDAIESRVPNYQKDPEWIRLSDQLVAATDGVVIAKGSIPGKWGDLVYETTSGDETSTTAMAIRPPGAPSSWSLVDAERDGAAAMLETPDLIKLERTLGSITQLGGRSLRPPRRPRHRAIEALIDTPLTGRPVPGDITQSGGG